MRSRSKLPHCMSLTKGTRDRRVALRHVSPPVGAEGDGERNTLEEVRTSDTLKES